jgi:hypothetical protein
MDSFNLIHLLTYHRRISCCEWAQVTQPYYFPCVYLPPKYWWLSEILPFKRIRLHFEPRREFTCATVSSSSVYP